MLTTGSVGTEVDKKLHFHEGEMKQLSRFPSCVGRVKDRRATIQKSLKLERKLINSAVPFKACGDLGASKMSWHDLQRKGNLNVTE